MEQAKQFDPDFGKGPEDEDAFEAALNFMDAVEGLNLQVVMFYFFARAGLSERPLCGETKLLESGS